MNADDWCDMMDDQQALADSQRKVKALQAERDVAENERIEWVKRGERAEALCNDLRSEVAQLKEALGWKKVDASRENWPLSFNKMKYSQAFMEELVEVQRQQAELDTTKIAGLREAVGIYEELIESGWLGRDTSRDHEHDWALKQLEPIGKLQRAKTLAREHLLETHLAGEKS